MACTQRNAEMLFNLLKGRKGVKEIRWFKAYRDLENPFRLAIRDVSTSMKKNCFDSDIW